nr:MAG TPA: virion morphogenesis protein [Caudoviricetes sp.]
MIGVKVQFTTSSLKKFADIEKQLNLLAQWKLVVQFNEDNVEANGQKVELIAMWLEYGSEGFNVHYPARPFWRTAIDANMQRIMNRFIFNANQVASGKMQARQCFEDIGKQIVQYIKKSIEQGSWAELAESTIKAKERKGSGTKPLIDTRTMVNSLEYIVKEI